MVLGQTQLKRIEQYKDRWTSYGANTGILELSEKPTPQLLKQFDIFKEYDDKFLEKISPDISVALWKPGTVLFEEGSYVDIAFYIVSGSVDVYLQKQQAPAPIFARGRTQVVSGQQASAERAGAAPQRTMYRSGEVKRGGKEITFLASMDFDLPTGTTLKLGAGDVFGEIGALNGWPQSATAKTTSTCQLVQIRTAALRLMRKRSTGLKARLDKLYKERTLNAHLRSTPLFQGVSESFLQALVQKVELVSCEPGDVIATEGSPAEAVYLVRSGFVRLSQQFAGGSIVVSYLSKGNLLGEAEVLLNAEGRWLFTATSQEYSELVKISRDDFRSVLNEQPEVEALLWEAVAARIKESGYSRKNINQSEFIARALDNGLVEGNSILVIDLNVCTRCDDCVRGCADTHGGIPRFVREGNRIGNFLVARACYHCEDPVCLIGCPTGAIRRTDVGDVVAIEDALCIGCGSCANNCPYDAIIMHETGETWPPDMIPEGLRGKPKQLASKCDLCYTEPAGPACVRSCPHGCAVRVGDVQEFRSLLWKEV